MHNIRIKWKLEQRVKVIPFPSYLYPGGGGGGGGGRGGKKCTFLYPGTKYGGQNPLTIHEIYAALMPSDSRSDSGLPSLLPLNKQRIIKS